MLCPSVSFSYNLFPPFVFFLLLPFNGSQSLLKFLSILKKKHLKKYPKLQQHSDSNCMNSKNYTECSTNLNLKSDIKTLQTGGAGVSGEAISQDKNTAEIFEWIKLRTWCRVLPTYTLNGWCRLYVGVQNAISQLCSSIHKVYKKRRAISFSLK